MLPTPPCGLQRQVSNVPFPLAFATVLRKQENILDRLSYWHATAYLEDAGHWLSYPDAIIRVTRERRHVMGQEDAAVACGPFQHRPIIRAGQPHVLNAHDVEIWPPTKQPAHDVAIEVFVRGQPKHERGSAHPPRHQPGSHTLRVEL
jgi:hypothetical protein